MNGKNHKQSHQLENVKTENSNFETINKMAPFFKGRIGRNEFAWSFFMFVMISIVCQICSPPDDKSFILITGLVIGFANASLIVQRLHDLGRPGYHFWLIFIPIHNIIFILTVLCVKKGQIGANKYGLDPLKLV